jgi:hypothetical protein
LVGLTLHLLFCVQLVHEDRLYRARCRRSQNPQALILTGIRVVHKRLFTAELQDIWR